MNWHVFKNAKLLLSHQELINRLCEEIGKEKYDFCRSPSKILLHLIVLFTFSIAWCRALITSCDWVPKVACASKWHNSLESCCTLLCQSVYKRTCCSDYIMKRHNEILWSHVVLKKYFCATHTAKLWFKVMAPSCFDKELPADGNITAEGPCVSTSAVISSAAPTPIPDRRSSWWFCRWLPSIPFCFLWSPLWMYLFLHHEVYLSLPSLKAEPLAFSSSDETSWAPSVVSPRPLHQRDWALLFYPVVCSWTPAQTSFAAAETVRASSGRHIFHTQLITKAAEACSRAAQPCLEHMHQALSVQSCPGLDLTRSPGVGLQQECRGVVLTRGEKQHQSLSRDA